MLWNRLKHGDRLVIRCACGQEHEVAHDGKQVGVKSIGTVVLFAIKRLTKRRKSRRCNQRRQSGDGMAAM